MKRLTAIAVSILLIIVLTACPNKKDRNKPKGGTAFHTEHGTLRIINKECPPVDTFNLRERIDRAYERGAKQRSGVSNLRIDGLHLVLLRTVEPCMRDGKQTDCRFGDYSHSLRKIRASCHPDILARVKQEDVVEHELFHYWCYLLKCPKECTMLVDHGRNGYDLNCNRLPLTSPLRLDRFSPIIHSEDVYDEN